MANLGSQTFQRTSTLRSSSCALRNSLVYLFGLGDTHADRFAGAVPFKQYFGQEASELRE